MAHRKRMQIIRLIKERGGYEGTRREDLPKKLLKQFSSYAAVMRALEVGQTALLRVEEGSGDFWIHMGYGEVTRDSLTSYTCPRRLMHDY